MYFFKGEAVDFILFGFVDDDKKKSNGDSWLIFHFYPAYAMVSKKSI